MGKLLKSSIMKEKVLLTVDDSRKNVSRTYSSLRNEIDYFDATLVSEDGVHFYAHKVVLAASSQFFQTSFKAADHPKPMLFFSGINSNLLNSIVDFIYYGEVEISKKNMKSFFEVAERFKMDGIPKLHENDIYNNDETNEDTIEEPFQFDKSIEEPIQPSVVQLPIKEELIEDNLDLNASMNNSSTQSAEFDDPIQTNSHEEAMKVIEELCVKTDDVWFCKRCDKSFPLKQKLKYHLEKHVRGLSYECSICFEVCRSKFILANHKKRKHHSKSDITL